MASNKKAPKVTTPLSFVEIVMRADAETIKAALEARVKVDGLLAEREAAYQRIAELEKQVDELMGEPGVFVFPAPPMPVADCGRPPVHTPAPARKAPLPKTESAKENTSEAPAAETEL